MELINRYELQVSELKSSYMEEKEMRDRFLKHSQKIYSMVVGSHNLSLEELVLAISKYEEEVTHLKEN
jgi:hypothetical protein